MPEIDDARIILGRPILATTGCHIDVREGQASVEVAGHFILCLVIRMKTWFLLILLYCMH